jgi:hypothetical protein
MAATAVFLGAMALLGGPTRNDATESLYSTWAISHGELACAYPPAHHLNLLPLFQPVHSIAPLWPLVSGGVAALTRLGHVAAFPSHAAMGPHCSHAFDAMYQWAFATRVELPTVGIGYLSWFILMGGAIAMLRTSGRGRCRWEPAALIVLAGISPVWSPLLDEYHPQDLVAVGLVLAGLACARKSWWAWTGVFLGLAFTAQQFALLVIVPLIVMAPRDRVFRFVGSAVGVAALVAVPVIAITSGQALNPIVLGSGDASVTVVRSTVVWEMHLPGALRLVVSRMLPIALSLVLAWWATRRLGKAVLEPVPLLSVVALSLSFRLVFDTSLWGYYFMALAVLLVLLDVACGRFRGQLVAWLALVTLAYNPVPFNLSVNVTSWDNAVQAASPVVIIGIGLLLVIRDVFHRQFRLYLLAWLVLAVLAFANWPPWMDSPLRHPLPNWFWQIILVTTGIALAAGPLMSLVFRGPWWKLVPTQTRETPELAMAEKRGPRS